LTLPESLGQGKFCLCADTPPLREIGGDLIDYAPRWDVKTWAQKIIRYSTDKKLLARYEKKIKEKWPQTRWKDTAKMIYGEISKLTEKVVASKARAEIWKAPATPINPVIWMDVTTTFLWWRGGISGIIRTELNFIKYLKKTQPNVRFFAHADDYFFEVQPHYLWWLFDDSDLQTSYEMFQDYWEKKENAKLEYRNPFQLTGIPISTHPAYLAEFPANSIVFMAGIDANVAGPGPRSQIVKKLSSSDRAVLVSQLIYDFTPILYPHFHTKETCIGYSNFIEYSSNNFDHFIYGGLTAQRDGLAIQKEHKWKVPLNDVLHFGSNFDKAASLTEEEQSIIDTEVLAKFELDQAFIITVGTIEPRKNHDMLYKAYVTLLSRSEKAVIPKLLFIGKKGWKSDDFLANFEADERVRGHVKILSPTDGELDVLYRRCLFTLLPSFYEGWSLTLPESLSHGKFCLTSDVAPLRETGRDLVEYINPLDTYAWADRIHYYSTHPEILVAKEAYIKEHWKPKTWLESTNMLTDALYTAHKARYNPKPHSQQTGPQAPFIVK
jgi:glycosyltransferase involved in cell wall biosynthesis